MSDWPQSKIDRLTKLWLSGEPTAEIGRAMGISKNAAVGKAHRIGLPGRPSPIKRGAGAVVPARRARAGQALPAGACLPGAIEATKRERGDEPRPAAPPTVPAVSTPRPIAGLAMCQWPIGDPKAPGFHFCGARAAEGRPYCAAHTAVAYVRVRDLREDAVA